MPEEVSASLDSWEQGGHSGLLAQLCSMRVEQVVSAYALMLEVCCLAPSGTSKERQRKTCCLGVPRTRGLLVICALGQPRELDLRISRNSESAFLGQIHGPTHRLGIAFREHNVGTWFGILGVRDCNCPHLHDVGGRWQGDLNILTQPARRQ